MSLHFASFGTYPARPVVKPVGEKSTSLTTAPAFGSAAIRSALHTPTVPMDSFRPRFGQTLLAPEEQVLKPDTTLFKHNELPQHPRIKTQIAEGFNSEGKTRYTHYTLMTPFSKQFMIDSVQALTPQRLEAMRQVIEAEGIFDVPLYDPSAPPPHPEAPWLPKKYDSVELEKQFNQATLPDRQILSIPSAGAPQSKKYFSWWLRDSEIGASAHLHSMHPDKVKRETNKRIGTAIVLNNFRQFMVPRRENILGFLNTRETYNRVRQCDTNTNAYFLVKANPFKAELDHPWPHLQIDALGMHLSSMASLLQEGTHVTWKGLSDEEKQTFTLLYAFLARYKYWETPDSGAWEHDPGHVKGVKVRSSSVGMAINGMMALQKLLFNNGTQGEAIRKDMTDILNNVPRTWDKDFWRESVNELTAPLNESTGQAFEKTWVAPGFKRLYMQLPFECAEGLSSPGAYEPIDGQKNQGRIDSATLMIPRYAPGVLQKMREMKEQYFNDLDPGETVKNLRKTYSLSNEEVAQLDEEKIEKAQQRNLTDDFTELVLYLLNSNEYYLSRDTGDLRYAWDEYNQKQAGEAQWTNFDFTHTTVWLDMYLREREKGSKTDWQTAQQYLTNALDTWNHGMASLIPCVSTLDKDPDRKPVWKFPESIEPVKYSDGKMVEAEPNTVIDLAWTHAEGKAAWERLQLACRDYITHRKSARPQLRLMKKTRFNTELINVKPAYQSNSKALSLQDA